MLPHNYVITVAWATYVDLSQIDNRNRHYGFRFFVAESQCLFVAVLLRSHKILPDLLIIVIIVITIIICYFIYFLLLYVTICMSLRIERNYNAMKRNEITEVFYKASLALNLC